MNRQLIRLALVAVGLLVALVVATTYWQSWAAGGLAARQDNAVELVSQFQVSRGLILASNGKTVLAAGLTFGFALQTFIIVGGILRVIPLTGITLPFVSYGGSSVVANFLVVAGLMLVSHRANTESRL